MSDMPKIDKDIPFTSPPNRAWGFDRMAVGDSFAVPKENYLLVRSAASYYGTRNGQKFSVRTYGGIYRCWRIA